MYREPPGSLRALQRGVERLGTLDARRRRLQALPDAARDEQHAAELAEIEREQAVLEEVAGQFEQAFAEAVEARLAAGGSCAARVGALLEAVPTMVNRTRSAQAVFDALRASRSMLGAVEVRASGARRSKPRRSGLGLHSRTSIEARLGVSVTRLLGRLEAASAFARTAGLDPVVVEWIESIHGRLFRDTDAGIEVLAQGLVAVRAELEHLVTTTSQSVDELERRSQGSARQLFELVVYD